MKLKTIVMAVCAGAAACLSAQGTASLVPPAPAETTVAAGDVVKVQGKGSGTTRDEALKDAYRDAIERAVGLYVDAEQMIKNDELVNDQILTQSNAYIKKYDVVKESEANGLFTVRILATVKKTALAKKISDVMPKQSINLGNAAANLHAQIVTQEKRNVDAVALLQNALKDVKPITQLMTFTLAETKMIPRKMKSGNGACFYHFKMVLDEKKYFEEFLPPLMKVFDQIAVEPPKVARFRKVSLAERRQGRDMQNEIGKIVRYLTGDWDEKNYERGGRQNALNLDDSGRLNEYSFVNSCESAGGVFTGITFLADAQGDVWNFSLDPHDNSRGFRFDDSVKECSAFPVVVISQANEQRTNVQAKRYMLPLACMKVVAEWELKNVLGKDFYGNEKERRQTVYNIIFKDQNGEEVYSIPFSIANTALSNTRLDKIAALFGVNSNGKACPGWYVTPFIHADSKEFHRWIGFEIPRDDLPKVAAIEIELAEQ